MTEIKIDYDNAISQSAKLENAAQECIQQANDAAKTANSLTEVWAGISGMAMQEKYSAWIAKQQKIGNQLSDVAKQIRSTAEKMKAEDEELARVINAGDGGNDALGSGAGGGFR